MGALVVSGHRIGLAALYLILVGYGSAVAIDCDTLPPRTPVTMNLLQVFQFNGGANCWGYIAPDGTEYAIMGARDGIDVVNVNALTVVGHIPMQFCSWRELKTYRHYCYVVSECTGPPNEGMMIVDLQYLPDSLHLVGTYAPGGNIRSHCISIDTARGFAYLVRQNYSGFRIVSLANPEAPADVGFGVNTNSLHDMTAFNDTVYAAEGGSHAFSIWNVANKTAPQMLARVVVPGGGYMHNIWPTADRRYLATTEETAFKTVKIWNCQNFASIQLVAQYLGPSNLAHNAHIEGTYLFLSHYESGVSVLDITTPECPVEVALYDTYEPADDPVFDGCWGVYPHTYGHGTVYASNIDGRFFIFQTNIITADFSAAPRIGPAPLSVDFTDASPEATTWTWNFGDGGVSALPNPSHLYGPGLYTARLDISSPRGNGTRVRANYITALAETLRVDDAFVTPGTAVQWEVRLRNHVPLAEIKLPISLTGIPFLATLDSITTDGCGTHYFERQLIAYDNRPVGQMALHLKADNGGGSPPLPAGDNTVARIFLSIDPTAFEGGTIVLSTPQLGSHTLNAITLTTSFVPAVDPGALTVAQCVCSCHADPVCDGSTNVLDVTGAIDVAMRGVDPTIDGDCPHSGRTDVNCDGVTNVVDVVLIINVSLRGADPAMVFCNPCA